VMRRTRPSGQAGPANDQPSSQQSLHHGGRFRYLASREEERESDGQRGEQRGVRPNQPSKLIGQRGHRQRQRKPAERAPARWNEDRQHAETNQQGRRSQKDGPARPTIQTLTHPIYHDPPMAPSPTNSERVLFLLAPLASRAGGRLCDLANIGEGSIVRRRHSHG